MQANDPLAYFKAKLSPELFKGEEEKKVFALIDHHFRQYRVLPQLETVVGHVPGFAEIEAVEPPDYYLSLLDNRFLYDRLNSLTTEIQSTLKTDKLATSQAMVLLRESLNDMTRQRMRRQVLDMGAEGGQLLMTAYAQKLSGSDQVAVFGWEYLDTMTNGVMPGDVISYVGRPAQGKTWFMTYGAYINWVLKKGSILLVSMEMNSLQIAQRIGAIYTKVGVKGLKEGQLTTPMFKRLKAGLQVMSQEETKLYVLDGNLTANIEEIYGLAQQLGCVAVYIDGAYLTRSMNPRLDRYQRAAENVDYMKRASGEIGVATFASWQFNRDAAKKDSKKGQKAGLEDIGYTDAIGQISSIVLGLMQEDGVETINRRHVSVLKGRNGEVGGFDVNWLFDTMDFSQAVEAEKSKLEFV
jgi:replicative DNA helicase